MSRYLEPPRVRDLGLHEGHRVYLVDGERVRNEIEVDFTMGGTFMRWRFIPGGEIWIDENLCSLVCEST